MTNDKLPEMFKGYLTEDLLRVQEEISSTGTKAPKEMILALRDLQQTYRLGLFKHVEPQNK